MEKVPSLDMFTQRHLRKSSSLSKINHHEGSSRPTSSFQAQSSTFSSNMHSKGSDYYGQSLKILNIDSRINQNLKQIDNRHEGYLKKTNIKRFTQNQVKQQQHQQQAPVQTQKFADNTFPPQMIHQNQQVINFGFNANSVNRQNIQPIPVHFVPNGNQVIMHGPVPQFPPQQQQFIPIGQPNIRILPPHPQNVQHVPFGHPLQGPPVHGHPHLQRANSTQNLQYREYNQPDRVLSSTNIISNCNNEEDIKVKSRPQQNKAETYTFRDNDNQLKSTVKKTYNPFLFDATYLLQIKDSESKLPDITLATSTKEYYEQLDKKKGLMEELIQIKESNLVEGQNFLNQLDCLIQQFQGRELTKGKCLDESQMRGSRRSLFAKVQ